MIRTRTSLARSRMRSPATRLQVRWLRLAAASLALPFAPSSAGAGLISTGEEIVISSDTTATRHHPAVAGYNRYYGSDFVVVWDEQSPATEGIHIFASRTDGRPETESDEEPFQVDPLGSSINEFPDVVATPDGQFVVVWRRDPADGGRATIVGIPLSRWGEPGTEFRVNTARALTGEYYLGPPEITVASDGSFVVVWASGEKDDEDAGYGPRTDIFARRLTSDFVPVGADVAVSTPGGDGLEETEFRPDVAATKSGEFVVVWTRGEMGPFGSQFTSRARLLDSLAQPTAAEIEVGAGGLIGPRIGAPRSGGFRVAWSDYEIADTVPHPGSAVLARSFDTTGAPLGDAFVASSPGDPLAPFAGAAGIAATHGRADELVLAWTSRTSDELGTYGGSSDGDGWGVFARAFEFDGEPFGDEVQVNESGAGDQVAPDVAAGYDSELLMVWEAEGIYARRFKLSVPRCGDADADESPSVRDALLVLQAAVGHRACDSCLCDADGSGLQTAADALLVLRDSVGIRTTLSCPACADPFARQFALATEVPCYGVYVELPALVEGSIVPECKPNPALAAAGCEVAFSDYYYPSEFDARGCSIEGQPLFSCHLSGADAAEVALTAEVACGCGCAETCPSAPQVCATITEQSFCSPGASVALEPSPARAVFTTVAQPQTLVTSSTTCGTCCDYTVQANIDMPDEVTVTELLIRFEGGQSVECPNDHVTCDLLVEAGGPGYTRAEGGTVEICLSDRDGISGPIALGRCEVTAGYFVPGPAEILRALDDEFHPLDPPPTVIVNDQVP